jgi:PAS domain S-box-containing protein
MNECATDLESNPLAMSVIALMKDGLFALDSKNRIEIINDVAVRILGFSTSDEVKGRHIEEFYASQDALREFIDRLELTSHCEQQEGTLVRKDGTNFKCVYSGVQLSPIKGSDLSKLILLTDATDSKATKQKLEEYMKRLENNNKMLDQFAYIVSHDLKAPLRAISNLSLWLQEDLGTSLSDDNKKNMDMLRGRVVRLESLINGILEYSKVGRVQMEAESVDVYSLLTDVVEMLAPPSHIQVLIGNTMPVLEAPRIMLVQIFSNLISNAIKYNTKEQGRINITCCEKDQEYQFVVEDNGPGISPEFFEKIFIIFQTLQSRDKFESTGIGLTIVKRIVEENGGKIWVESEEGTGSKFVFNWPRRKGESEFSKLSVG